jgi:hypothetical protein
MVAFEEGMTMLFVLFAGWAGFTVLGVAFAGAALWFVVGRASREA